MSVAKQPHPVNYRPGPELTRWLEDRAERSLTPAGLSARTRTELTMWRTVLAAELGQQRWALTELAGIAAALNGVLIGDAVPSGIGHCAVELADARRGREDEWDAGVAVGFDGDHVVAKLARLGPAADMALADAVSRWWDAGHEHSVYGWAAVGIRVASVRDLKGSLRHDGPPVSDEDMSAAIAVATAETITRRQAGPGGHG